MITKGGCAMYQNYLITGATGFLGSAVVQLLLAHGCRVFALVMNNDPLIHTLPKNVTVFWGDLTDRDSLRDFFTAGGDDFCVLHCGGLISIASKPDEALYAVNVQGTQNIIDLSREFGAGRLIYVSSVHAIPERPVPETITENCQFAPEHIHGDYGKSKAMATALVLEAAQNGLNASVVLPSGINVHLTYSADCQESDKLCPDGSEYCCRLRLITLTLRGRKLAASTAYRCAPFASESAACIPFFSIIGDSGVNSNHGDPEIFQHDLIKGKLPYKLHF
jgi:NAD(P)-dependent dehydrogenase (short-subunit alcohol dehydrogenase family)